MSPCPEYSPKTLYKLHPQGMRGGYPSIFPRLLVSDSYHMVMFLLLRKGKTVSYPKNFCPEKESSSPATVTERKICSDLIFLLCYDYLQSSGSAVFLSFSCFNLCRHFYYTCHHSIWMPSKQKEILPHLTSISKIWPLS